MKARLAHERGSPGGRAMYLSLEPLVPGQASYTHVHMIADGLAAYGWAVSLVAREVPQGVRRSLLSRLALYARLTIDALRQVSGVDIVYVRAHPAAALIACWARLVSVPVVHEINGRTDDLGVTYGLPNWATSALTYAQHWQYRRAAALVAVTPGLANWASAIVDGQVAVEIVTNGADGDFFYPRAPGGPTLSDPYVIFFGGLVAWHGVATMLKARSSPLWPTGLKLVIVGDGPGRDDVLRAAAGSENQVLAMGYLPRADVAGLAARALAVLCPIEAHGARDSGGVAPLKLFEGMASGRPVIASDLPFQAELVRDLECGIVVPVGDAYSLAKAAAMLAADRGRADELGRNGRAAIEQKFDWRFRVQDIAAILQRCARNRYASEERAP